MAGWIQNVGGSGIEPLLILEKRVCDRLPTGIVSWEAGEGLIPSSWGTGNQSNCKKVKARLPKYT